MATTTASRTAGWRRQSRLDLPRARAREAADLHLVVGVGDELDLAVRLVAAEVAGAVELGPPALWRRTD